MYNDSRKKSTIKYYSKMMRVGFTLKPEVWQVWKNFANNMNLPLNTMIKQAVIEYMENHKYKENSHKNH